MLELGLSFCLEKGVSVEGDVLWRDGGGHTLWGGCHKVHGVLGGDVLHYYAQQGQLPPQRFKLLLYEHLLAVEHVHVAVRHLAVNQQQHATLPRQGAWGQRGEIRGEMQFQVS
jgi:hypothetical protein